MTPETLESCRPNHPTPVIQIHGKQDFTVPYSGNSIMLPIDEVVEYWTDYNNCEKFPINNEILDNDGDDFDGDGICDDQDDVCESGSICGCDGFCHKECFNISEDECINDGGTCELALSTYVSNQLNYNHLDADCNEGEIPDNPSECFVWGSAIDSKAYNFIENIHQVWLLTIVDLIIGKTEYPPN